MSRWRRRTWPSTADPIALTAEDVALLTKARTLALGELLDPSKDAERRKRADEITDGRFSTEMEKYK